MNFSIEVPAEATPLTTQALYRVLQSAASSDQQQLKTGAQQLQNWEKSPGFYSSLQSLYVDYTLPTELRYLAIIQLKNGIDKYWRKTATNAIRKDEKDVIRTRCIDSGTNEPDSRLALQVSVLIAKIIRFDFPQDWPEAIESILQCLQSEAQPSGNSPRLSRSLLILLYAVKELSTARLQRSRTKLQSVTPAIIQVLSHVYFEKVRSWMSALQSGGSNEEAVSEDVKQSLLALRTLRRIIVVGYDFPNRDQDICNIWSSFTSHFAELLALVQNASATLPTSLRQLVEKHLVQVSKLHLEMAKAHPAGYSLLPHSIEISRSYWGLIRQFSESYGSQAAKPVNGIGTDGDADDDPAISAMEKVTLKGLLLIRACVKMVFSPAQTIRFQQVEDKEERKNAKELMKDQVLTEDLASEVMETLVSRFFIFTPRDLKQWEEEPDEWEKTQEGAGDDWEFSIRTCSEKLFLDLIINFKERLVQPLLAVFGKVADLQDSNVMVKDSIYAAIGLAAPVLERYPEFNFGHFLEEVLVQEVQKKMPGYNMLRRRAAIVLGQWLPVKDGLNRPLVYQIFQHLLDKNDDLNDQVVRVTSGRQLKNIVNPFEFTAEPFMPFASPILRSIMSLVGEVELPETKIALLETLRVVVTRLERSVIPFADQIISFLPPLWDQAGDEYLMKQTILGILSSLCTAMEAESRKYHPLILPLIQSSIDPSSETRLYLIDDAMELWLSILPQTPSDAVPQELISLVQYLFPIFDTASENLIQALEITEHYTYLIPSEILGNASAFLSVWKPLLGASKREPFVRVNSVVELLVRSAHQLGGPSAVEELLKTLVTSGWLSNILVDLHDVHKSNQASGPNRQLPRIDSIQAAEYFKTLSRLAIANPGLLVSAIEATSYDGQAGNESIDQRMGWLLSEWFEHTELISQPTHKKSNCLALTSLLQLSRPWILSRLQSLMNEWISTITELIVDVSLEEGNKDEQDCLVYKDPGSLKSSPEAPGGFRKRMLTYYDPVHQIDIRVFIREKLGVAIGGDMGAFEREWLQNVDVDVLNAFAALGIL